MTFLKRIIKSAAVYIEEGELLPLIVLIPLALIGAITLFYSV